MPAHRTSSITAEPLSPIIGAEVHGVDLARPLSPLEREEVLQLLLRHRVIFFRDQPINRDQQVAFARCFGEPEEWPGHAMCPAGYPQLIRIYNGPDCQPLYTDVWHADASFFEKPTSRVVLRSLEIPPVGGDTLFANMVAAYEGLPAAVKERIDGLVALHDGKKKSPSKDFTEKRFEELTANHHDQFEHPVVQIHPETGEKILYVNRQYTTRIKGLPPGESAELLEFLCGQAAIPEYQVRFRWRKDCIAVWDNLSTQHYASADYGKQVRRLERVGIKGLGFPKWG